ncbi:DNA-binding domain-containing protein [Dyella silvatica]|uniref:HvfC/BufC N-terminal domain-containing protein n=1 Tax=Dyella silvatica TaxID=2992128 RepID=UPI002253D443|nr:DNA-binding domain-containing protein [Dyella silvatica]
MSSLQALQQRLLQAVLADKTPKLPELRGDALADPATRLDVYRHGYRIRLRDALAIEFPGLRLMAGRRFGHLLDSYVEAHPSAHYNIRWHGAGLAAFLEFSRLWRDKPALAEMARLDWAISSAFDAADEPVISATDLAGVPAEAWAGLCLVPQSHLQILPVTCNVDTFRRAADQAAPRPHLRRYPRPRHLLVWRQELTVRYRVLSEDERPLLNAALREESFTSLCELLAEYHDPNQAMPRMTTLLRHWLEAGLISAYRLESTHDS